MADHSVLIPILKLGKEVLTEEEAKTLTRYIAGLEWKLEQITKPERFPFAEGEFRGDPAL